MWPSIYTTASNHRRRRTCCCAVWYERWEEGLLQPPLSLSAMSGLSLGRPTSPWERERDKQAHPQIHNYFLKRLHQHRLSYLETVLLVGSDDHIAFGLAVVAHALHAVDLGQVMDDLPVFSVHGWETVTPLWLFSLRTSVMRYYTEKLFQSCLWS